MRTCERILTLVPNARICIIGSCSGIKGSYDQLYGASKAGIHYYVKTRKVLDTQQLIAVSPCIISDSGMTRRRSDYDDVIENRDTVTAKQVADVVYGLLTMSPAVSNQIVPVGPC
jgi:NADP-dependent 3-hydroxy acid dehydrogenase YdfG